MPKLKTSPGIIAVLSSLCVLITCGGNAGTIHVPAEANTIQQAIDASTNLDTIVVSPGTYTENISFAGKNLILQSTDPTSQTIVNSTIIDGNAAESVVTFQGSETSYATITGFTITNGYGINGGGINGNGASPSVLLNHINGNTVVNNDSSGFGGGIYNCDGLIYGNVVSSNTVPSVSGGGLDGCDGLIQANVISSNSASAGGGLADCNGIIRGNLIASNTAFHGGGIYTCAAVIEQNVITANTADSGGGEGGGIYFSATAIRNNLIYGNSAGTGGGLATCLVTPIFNNTIYGNSATSSGGGISNSNGAITNNIVYANTAPAGAQLAASSTPTYSCIQNLAGGGTGNIANDPSFVNAAAGDFHLNTNSPCIDAGTATPGVSVDIDGNARPTNGTNATRGDGSDYDIGAYEAPAIPATIQVQPTSINFGNVVVFLTTQSPVTITNTGTRNLTITGIAGLTGTRFSVVSAPSIPFSVNPGASVQLHVQFAPISVIASNTVMTISSNDSAHPTVNVALSGTGINPPCFIGQIPTYADGIDLSAIVAFPKVKSGKTGGATVSGKFSVTQLRTDSSATSPTVGVPPTVANIYLLDTQDACSLDPNSTPLVAVPIKAGKSGKPGLPAKAVKGKFKTFTQGPTTGKYLLVVVDPSNQIHETDKTNNYLVVGPLP